MLEGSWLDDKEPTQIPDNSIDVPGADSWLSGQAFRAKISDPIILNWRQETFGGGVYWQMFPAPDPTALRSPEGYRRWSSYLSGAIPLVLKEIHNVLVEAGVDNVDAYPTEIHNQSTGERCRDYVAINIIGIVKAADMERSAVVSHNPQGLISVDFDSLVLNESVIADLKIFRLAECVTGIVIREDIKDYIERSGNFGMIFTDPEVWVG